MAEITVYNFAELRSAITDTTSDIINLGGDIIFSSGGIVVPKSKGDMILNGNGYMITDYSSSAYTNCIRYDTSTGSPVTFTIKNVVWNGRNYYGMLQVYDSAVNSNITLIFDNVTYTGPQAIHNRQGITRIKDSSFTITQNSAPNAPQELCEINRLYIEGNVSVDKVDTNAVIWFANYNTSLTVEANAVFTVNTHDHYMFYADASMPSMYFGENSVTDIHTLNGLYLYDSVALHIPSSFILASGASFSSIQVQHGSVPAFKCRDVFRMEDGSSLLVAMPAAGTSALMYFPIISTLEFNNPKSVVLYNNGGNVFRFGTGSTTNLNTINISAELLNMWTNATTPFESAGGFNDTPTRAFQKITGANIEATVYTTTSTTNSLTTNIVDGDKGYPMTSATFNIMSAKVLSMGNINIDLNEISDISTFITGITEPNANLKALYNSTELNGITSGSGQINLPIPLPIPVDTTIYFGVNWRFLIKYMEATVVGSVSITHLSNLVFKTVFVPYYGDIVKRIDPDWYVEVTDTRTSGNDWELLVSLPTPLTHDIDTLDDAVILEQSQTTQILSPTPILVYTGGLPNIVTQITWQQVEGLLLKLIRGFSYPVGTYLSTMNWYINILP